MDQTVDNKKNPLQDRIDKILARLNSGQLNIEDATNDLQFLVGAIVTITKRQYELAEYYKNEIKNLNENNLENRSKYEKARKYITIQDKRIHNLKQIYDLVDGLKCSFPLRLSKRIKETKKNVKINIDKLASAHL